MSRSRRIRSFLYLASVAAVYLITDVALHGPVGHRLALLRPGSADSIAKARAAGVIARVYYQPIDRSQLDRAVLENSCPPQQALEALIDEELLRHELRESGDAGKIAVTCAEVDEALRRFRMKFESHEAMASALKAEGFAGEGALRQRLESTLLLEKFILSRIESDCRVSEEEAREWFGKHAAELATPERVQARHVFLATLDREPAEAKQKLDTALGDLTAGKKEFATLVTELSEDEGSKGRGGDLGWMTRERLPADFILPVFALEQGKPALIRSKLGWHLVEVTARKPASAAEFDPLKPEIIAALEATKKTAAMTNLRVWLRAQAAGKIEVFDQL